jgi:hypothetical protein
MPQILINIKSLSFSATQNGSLPSNQTFDISNSGGGTLNWSITDDASWLDVNPSGGTGNKTITVSINTTNLAPNTYIAIITITSSSATNSPQTINVTYTVSGNPPIVTTSSASSITSTSATLSGTVNPNSLSTNAWFEWGTSSDLSSFSSTNSQSIGSGTSAINVTANLTGLTPNTTFYYKIAAQNSAGTQRGNILSFNTSQMPQISINIKSLSFSATQNGTLPQAKTFDISNSGGGTLNWSITDDASWLDISLTSGTGSNTITVSINTSNLAPNTYTSTITITASGATNSPQTINVTYIVSGNPPVVTTSSASSITQTSATLSGTVNPNGLSTNAWFEYDTKSDLSAYTSTTQQSIGSGTSALNVTANLTGLNPNTTYYYRIAAQNSAGIQRGAIQNFTTLRLPSVSLNKTSLSFTANQYSSLPAAQSFTISNGGDGTLNWVASKDASWLDIDKTSGTGTGAVNVSINTTNLTSLNNTATITVSASGIANSAKTIAVTYTLTAYPTSITLSTSISYPSYSSASNYKTTDWRIVGLPGESNLTLSTVLTEVNETGWQAYSVNTNGTGYVKYDNSSEFRFTLGKAFWIIKKSNLTLNSTASSASLKSGNAEISLHSGWNLITNPFTTTIPWSGIQSSNGNISQRIQSYQGSLAFSDNFEPYKGYWLDNRDLKLTSLKVPYSLVGQASSLSKDIDQSIWRLNIELKNGEYSDNIASLGVSKSAKLDKDAFDYRRPPMFGNMPEVNFNHPEWDIQFSKFVTDIRPEFEESQIWDFDINVNSREPSKLIITGLSDVPSNFGIYLIDKEKSKIYDLRIDSNYSFTPIAQLLKFSIIVGKEDIIREKAKSLTIPKEFELGANYPNPFNPLTTIPITIPYTTEVKIIIYNTLGKEIQILYSGILSRGRYYFEWDAKDFPSGIYLCRLMTNTNNLSTKMVLIK